MCPMQRKMCRKCNRLLNRDHFYARNHRKEYIQGYCRDCKRAMAREWYEQNRERLKPRQKARDAVMIAVRSRRIPRPDELSCTGCGKPGQQYHHYLGYEREHWLDVIPVCRRCHRSFDEKAADAIQQPPLEEKIQQQNDSDR